MLIDCPACATSYHVDPGDIDGGRTVICPRCDARWFIGELAAAPMTPPGFAALRGPATSSFASRDRASGTAPAAGGNGASRRFRPRVPRAVTWGLASLALVSLTIGARARIVHMLPRSAGLYAVAGLPVNLRGFDFRDVHVARLDPSSPLVTVSGEMRNVAGRRMRVPRIVFEILDGSGQSLVRWSERAPARLVGGGRTLAFASAPHQIPAESRSALVHFESDEPS